MLRMHGTSEILLTLSIALLSGLLLSRLAKKLGLPAVTAYLVAGVVIGPFGLGRLGFGFSAEGNSPEFYSILCDLALGFIAFAIGNCWMALRRAGKSIGRKDKTAYLLFLAKSKQLLEEIEKEKNTKKWVVIKRAIIALFY